MPGVGSVRPLVLAGLLLGVPTCKATLFLGPDADQGIEGIVFIGPQCPVPSEEDPCPDLPYAAILVVRHDGDRVTSVQSDEDGRFRVGLAPGTYRIVPENGDPFPVATPQDVIVAEGTYTSVTITYDTGIR